MKTKKLYKFLREGMKSQHGDVVWKIGEWKKEINIDICNSGFHASKEIGQAFSYIQGEILAEVEVKGESIKEDYKECWSEMRVTKVWKWQKKDSVALSIYAAELCIENYEKVYPNDKRPRDAIEATKKWLFDQTEENESAAESAAWLAARSAAESAESAAESAARLAARSAAESAESAARSAESAARSAAESAESAAWSAARSAESAARLAASSAARSAIKKITIKIYKWFDNHLNNLEPYV